MIQRLLEYHANPSLPNLQGQSAIDLAEVLKEENIVEMLKNLNLANKSDSKKDKKVTLSKEKKVKSDEDEKDEKIENYIKNYQIKNNLSEYNAILNGVNTRYSPLSSTNQTFLEEYLFSIYCDPVSPVAVSL
ncbi:hypothetical protein PIROE2DRAFT_67629 [Piromyces sp. E2]|nr:hypothetical protein PIROE2DRAFT_67629 [Piromyces sp. E2]|eukprot:OUM60061.1 hypothetical protein PIROE2DRAFT_67629 [Piromyces sp. E2]